MSTQKYFAYDQSRLKEILFPVETRDVWVPMGNGGEGKLFTDDNLVRIPRYHAVVDIERSHVFAVVSHDYDLVTNETAVNLGRECFNAVFKLTDHCEMQVFNIVMPQTRSFCHVDFVHSEASFDFYDKDPWTPFLRITNSYNRTHTLKFDLGFCRGICKNGLIAGRKNITFKFAHSKSSARNPHAEFNLREGEFATLETEFVEGLHNLKRYHVPRRFMWPLACKVFQLTIPAQDATDKQKDFWHQRQNAIFALEENYFDKLGENGYAALNVLTDYATRPTVEISRENRIGPLQTYAGSWMQEFVKEIESRDFDFGKYLGQYCQLAV